MVAFNAIAAAGRHLNLPVMVGVSEGERAFVGVRQAAALVRTIREENGQEIFLNADHTHSLATPRKQQGQLRKVTVRTARAAC